jgi:hypothetical protein
MKRLPAKLVKPAETHLTHKAACAVPDCEDPAVTRARISINNAPKRLSNVCAKHADAAAEDVPFKSTCSNLSK